MTQKVKKKKKKSIESDPDITEIMEKSGEKMP